MSLSDWQTTPRKRDLRRCAQAGQQRDIGTHSALHQRDLTPMRMVVALGSTTSRDPVAPTCLLSRALHNRRSVAGLSEVRVQETFEHVRTERRARTTPSARAEPTPNGITVRVTLVGSGALLSGRTAPYPCCSVAIDGCRGTHGRAQVRLRRLWWAGAEGLGDETATADALPGSRAVRRARTDVNHL